jgi:hypothetical protein
MTLFNSLHNRKSIKVSGRKSAKHFRGEKIPQIVSHEVFYCVSGIMNYDFDLSVSRFPKSMVNETLFLLSFLFV